MLGVFAAIGFLSKYLFIYLLISICLLFFYIVFIKKYKKFDFKYLISLEVFIVLLVPHLIWLTNNDYITITYGLVRAGLENSSLLDHIIYPLIFLGKQIGILIPFFIMSFFLIKKIKLKVTLEDIDFQVRDLKHEFSIIIVNDCSTEEKPTNDFNFNNLSLSK